MKKIQFSQQNSFPIPFSDFTLSQKQALMAINRVRTTDSHYFMGQFEMTDKLAVMVLCYLVKETFTLIDDQPANYFMLAKTEERRLQFIRILQKVVPFVVCWLKNQEKDKFCGSIKVYDEVDHFQEYFLESKSKSDKKTGKLFILTSRTYLKQKIKAKENQNFQKQDSTDIYLPVNKEEQGSFHRASKKIQFMLIQTNDLNGMLQEVFSIQLGQAQITRAWVQANKLHRFYHDRSDSKKINNLKPEILQKLKQRSTNRTSTGSNKRWRIQKYDQLFNKLAQNKLNQIKRVQHSLYASRGQLQQFSICNMLIHLQTINYLCNHLMTELHSTKYEDYLKAQQYLVYLQDNRDSSRINNANKPCIKRSVLKRLKRIFNKFISMYPPQILGRRLSTFYLEQVLEMFQKLTVWHQIFSHKRQDNDKQSSFILLRYLKQMNPTSKVQELVNQKIFKEQQIKLTTFNTSLLIQLLTQGVKSQCIFQKNAYAQQYFRQITASIEPSIKYLGPLQIQQQMQTNLMTGLIVHCTANDEQLYINSYKLQQKQETLETQEKKQVGQHYWQLIRTFGVMVYDICSCSQDGIVVYFPSRQIMKDCRAQWQSKQNIYQKIQHQKYIFEQSQYQEKNRQNVAKYRKLCDMGRGAIFFLSANSQMGKYQTFNKHYSRVVIFIGVPYPQLSLQIEAKFKHLGIKTHDKSKMHMYCFRQAMVTVARCLSNCGNDPNRRKVVIFADNGFRSQKVIPKWLPWIRPGSFNSLSIVEAVSEILKNEIAQFSINTRMMAYFILISNEINAQQSAYRIEEYQIKKLCKLMGVSKQEMHFDVKEKSKLNVWIKRQNQANRDGSQFGKIIQAFINKNKSLKIIEKQNFTEFEIIENGQKINFGIETPPITKELYQNQKNICWYKIYEINSNLSILNS